MLISSEELKKYISGAIYFEEDNGLIPYRFTKECIENSYDTVNKIRRVTETGIKIDFYSDTEEVSFNYTAFTGFSSEIYKLYFFDVYADDTLILHQGEKDVSEDRDGKIFVKLKSGDKRITIYLPGSCAVKISDFTISDGASISAVSYEKSAIFFGDSITHAAYVDFPSLTYANLICKRFEFDALNQAIGGDVFSKHHLKYLPEMDFDAVFVAYGTNDWKWANSSSKERIEEFFDTLGGLYRNSKKYVILPIWRGDMAENKEFKYSFEDIREIIRECALKHKMNVIESFDFVPHIPKLFYDGYLHPNEMGFAFYADEVEKYLTKRVGCVEEN